MRTILAACQTVSSHFTPDLPRINPVLTAHPGQCYSPFVTTAATVAKLKNMSRESHFKQELTKLINQFNIDGDCHLPDFILADYLFSSLLTLKKLQRDAVVWRGKQARQLNPCPFCKLQTGHAADCPANK